MPDVSKILKTLLSDRRLVERAAFTSRTYSDQPIIQTGKQLRERMERNRGRISDLPHVDYTPDGPPPDKPQQPSLFSQAIKSFHDLPFKREKVPERYYQLREMAESQGHRSSSSIRGSLAYGTRSANRLFYEQARLMEDFEDDYEFEGDYVQYFPTYSSMTLRQLRGYFSWRTRVRAGEMPEAPLSFAFLYVYELLCGIGTTPGEQGFHDLVAFRDAFSQLDAAKGSTFNSYLRRWLKDYVVYHGLDPELIPDALDKTQDQVLTLLQAEQETLTQQGFARKNASLSAFEAPDDEALLAALNDCSSYQICGARLFKTNPDDVRAVTCETFRALVLHCSKRRKTDFVEGFFGNGSTEPYTMFSSAVFYEPEPHADVVVALSPVETFTCQGGRWRRSVICQEQSRSSDLGAILHAVDGRLRERLDYPYPLKERPVAAYVTKIIEKAIDALLARKADEERRRIDIDLSRLASIRAAAAVTQEALLTDEERDEGIGTGERQPELTQPLDEAGTSGAVSDSDIPSSSDAATEASPEQGTGSSLLAPEEEQTLRALFEGRAPEPTPGGKLLSLVIDSINEKLFDVVGDAVIEYGEDEPSLVEDYWEDVREILRA